LNIDPQQEILLLIAGPAQFWVPSSLYQM